MQAIIDIIQAKIERARRRAKYRRMAGKQRARRLAREAKQAEQRAAVLAAHPNWARRQDQLALDNALWCWRQAKDPGERRAVLGELGAILIPYWEARRQARQEGWARQQAWRRGRR